MVTFLLIVCSVPLMGLVWLAWAEWRLRKGKAPAWLRVVLAGMIVLNVLGFAGLVLTRVLRWDFEVPRVLLISTFVWHIVVLPIIIGCTSLWMTGAAGLWARRKLLGKRKTGRGVGGEVGQTGSLATITESQTALADPLESSARVSRRQFLAAGIAGGPVLLQATAVSTSLAQLGSFRVRELIVQLPQLPIDFDGFVIAHVTDTHVGAFTKGNTLDAIVRAVNGIKADCVVHTGDLINDSLEDMQAAGAMLAQFRSVHGTFIVEGNHDLFQSRTRFAELLRTRELQEAKLTLLLNEGAMIERGSGRIQMLGLQWGNPATQDIRTDRGRGAMLQENCAILDATRDPRAMQVLLAHHPDAFDHARERGIALTLAGHTHGGQLNILPGVGPASATYQYLSGLYERRGSTGEAAACVVGNGTGNWFPLRINAPAEIIKVVLRRG